MSPMNKFLTLLAMALSSWAIIFIVGYLSWWMLGHG
jgi:hypothetical protein